jgi:hypothetical protein
MDPNTFNNMAKDPKVHELINDPKRMEQILKTNPALQALCKQDPSLRDALCNPELMKDLLQPESIAEAN